MTHDHAIILLRLFAACLVVILCGFIGRMFQPSKDDGSCFALPSPLGAAFVIASWAAAMAVMLW